MVVVVVIGVLSAMLLPALGGPLQRRKLAGAAGNLHLAMRALHEVAVTRGRTCRLLLQPASGGEPGRYAAEVQAIRAGGRERVREAGRRGLAAHRVARGRALRRLASAARRGRCAGRAPGGAALMFFADGSAGGAVVPLTNGQASWSVVVAPNTGRASLIKGVVTALPGGREDLDG